MEILVFAAFVAGTITGRFFKVFILLPIGLGTAAAVWLKCAPGGILLLDYAADVCLLVIILEFGYFAGGLLTGISVQAFKLRGFRVRPRH